MQKRDFLLQSTHTENQNSSYTKRKNKTQEIEQFSKHLPCNICILFFVILALEKILMIIINDVWFVDLLHRNYFAKSGLFRYFDFRVFTYIFNGCFSTCGTLAIIIRVPGFAPSTQQAIGEFFSDTLALEICHLCNATKRL